MSINTGYKPRNDPNGKYEVVCQYRHCGVTFHTNHPKIRYCCFAHKNLESNYHDYQRHRKHRINAVIVRRVQQQRVGSSIPKNDKLKTVTRKTENDFDSMSPEEIMEWIRNNPGQVRGNK